MSLSESLQFIRQAWLEEVGKVLTRVEGVRSGLEKTLAAFFDQLLAALESGNLEGLDLVVGEWARAGTESQLGSVRSSMTPVFNNMLTATVHAARIYLPGPEALSLTQALLPIFGRIIETAVNEEIKAKTNYIQDELVEAREELARDERTKSDFISVAAHELKTPLTLIEGYASMMREAIPDDAHRLQAALCLKGINAGTRRLREIVDDMIDVSMIENKLLALNFQPLWLNRILDAVKRDLGEIVRQRKQTLTIKPFGGSNEMLFADGERLYQALRNLVTNAIKYTPDGGRIIVDGRLLPGFVEIVVADSGIGIAPQNQQRIFEKFGRVGDVSLHSSGKTKFKGGGPGLGLPITKGIIEAHGGAIWVESEGYDEVKCPGSKFHIMLPLLKAPPDPGAVKSFRGLIQE